MNPPLDATNLEENLHLNEFSSYLEQAERSPITIRGYVNDVRIFAEWYERSYNIPLKPELITNEALRTYKHFLLERPAKPQTINRRLASLAAYAHWAIEAGYIATSRNPALGIKVVRQAQLAPRWLNKNECARLVRAIEKEVESAARRYPRLHFGYIRDAAIVLLVLNTGLRSNEVVTLQMSDVQVTIRGGSVTVRTGKGGKFRKIPLNGQARKALLDYLAIRPDCPSQSFFIGQRGEGIQNKTIQRAVKRFTDAASLPEATPHILRHTFAKTLINKGVSLEKVAALLGHTNLNTTQIYTTPGEDDLSDAVDKLDE